MKNIFRLFIVYILVFVLFSSLSPKKDYEVTPADFGLNFKEYSIKTKDGATLKSWYFPSKKKSGTLVIVSHDGEGNMASVMEIASNYLSLGYSVLTYDYRGYGGSSAFKINSNFVVYSEFAKDLDAVIDYAFNKIRGNNKIYLHGKGMGAAISIGVGAKRRAVTKIIADSPWDDLNNYQKVMKEVKQKELMIPLAYERPLLDPKFALAGKYAKMSEYLLIHGGDDDVFTSKMMKNISKVNASKVKVESIKKATYDNTFSKDKTAYFKLIEDFLN